MKNKKSLKEMSKVPLIKYSKADHRNQVATELLHLKTNHKHSLPQLIDDPSLSREMLDNKNSLVSLNNDQHLLLRIRLPPQIMAPIKLLIVVNSMVLMQSQRREERN